MDPFKVFDTVNHGTADLVTFTEEILNEKLHFCAASKSTCPRLLGSN